MTRTPVAYASQAAGPTAASQTYRLLHDDIVSGVYAPSARLKISELCARYQVTSNPLREALNRLVSDGVVDLKDHRGFFVAPVSVQEWNDIARTRILFETTLLREAVARRTMEWEDKLVLALHHLCRTPRFIDTDQGLRPFSADWEPNHHRFHEALIATANAEIGQRYCRELRLKTDRYRQMASRSPEARTTYDAEHSAMAEAAIAGRVGEACDALAAHYERTRLAVLAYLENLN